MFSQKEIERIRSDFAPLRQKPAVVYFDSACTSLKPGSVIKAQMEYQEGFPACAERSSHSWGEKTSRLCEDARSKIAGFIGAKSSREIIFTKNATEGINFISRSLNFKEGDLVLTSDKEHNSNLLPWLFQAKKRGIRHCAVPSAPDNSFDFENFERILGEEKNVKLVSIVHTSNLDGHTFPAREITDLAHKAGAMVLLDATQSVPHQRMRVRELDADFLVFSGHKMLGPSGIGVLYGKSELLKNLEPFMLGGGTVSDSSFEDFHLLDFPQKFEAGIQNYSGILGLGAAVDYLEKIGIEKIKKHEEALNSFLTERLEKFPETEIIGPADAKKRGSVITFNIKGKNAQEVAGLLNEAGIMVRAGQFCVHSWFNSRKIKSAVRASLYFYNIMEEAEIFAKNMERIIKL